MNGLKRGWEVVFHAMISHTGVIWHPEDVELRSQIQAFCCFLVVKVNSSLKNTN